MITRFFNNIVRYGRHIPFVAPLYTFLHNLPRAIRVWVCMILAGFVIGVGMMGYALYVFFLYAGAGEVDTPSASATVSLSTVRELVQRMQDREASFVAPDVVDPAR